MSELLKIVKQRMERTTCSVHSQSPKISIVNDNLSMDCCCDDFRTKLSKQLEVEVEKATAEIFKKMFKNL
jgi:hypothetical protein